jgi:glycine cleavage system regulatory protein
MTHGETQHAALWLIGPDMPGLLRMGAKFVADRGGNIDKDIADKFGEKVVVFMSITAKPDDIKRMEREKDVLKVQTKDLGVVFQPMKEPTVPPGFKDDLYGVDIVTDDAPGIIVELTALLAEFHMLIVGHTGERRTLPGPRPKAVAGQKFIVMLPYEFDHVEFTHRLSELVRKHNGTVKTPLRTVPGLLWWW